jgi:hypothetical protein
MDYDDVMLTLRGLPPAFPYGRVDGEKNQVEERVVVTILREKGEQGSLENLERE